MDRETVTQHDVGTALAHIHLPADGNQLGFATCVADKHPPSRVGLGAHGRMSRPRGEKAITGGVVDHTMLLSYRFDSCLGHQFCDGTKPLDSQR